MGAGPPKISCYPYVKQLPLPACIFFHTSDGAASLLTFNVMSAYLLRLHQMKTLRYKVKQPNLAKDFQRARELPPQGRAPRQGSRRSGREHAQRVRLHEALLARRRWQARRHSQAPGQTCSRLLAGERKQSRRRRSRAKALARSVQTSGRQRLRRLRP